jgi:hypothetical protein
MSLLMLIFSCRQDCPPNSYQEDGCLCEIDYYGDITWDKQRSSWEGECISGLEMAVQTGDPSYIKDDASLLAVATEEIQETVTRTNTLLSEIYGDGEIQYNPTEWSHHIKNADIDGNFILIQGSDYGYPLASAGVQGTSRYAAFGMNIITSLENGSQAAFESQFDRILSWLLTDTITESLSTNYSIGFSSIGWEQSENIHFFSTRFDSVEDCDSTPSRSDCFESVDLIVIGAQGNPDDGESIALEIKSAMQSGVSVLFLHTETWADSIQGAAVLQELNMGYGDYGGNYWSMDKADWEHVSDMLELGGSTGSILTVLNHFKENDYDFDWSTCSEFVGQISCNDVPNFRTEFLNGAHTIRFGLASIDKSTEIFTEDGYRIWKLLGLLGDVYRRDIQYPMDKQDTDPMRFLRSYYADHAVLYRRDINAKQEDLGTFSLPIEKETVSIDTFDVSILASKYGGFTAIGHYVLPGETFSITRTDELDLSVSVMINTQRTGSTREFNEDQYDRPKFLQSPSIPLPSGETVTLTSPYGGTLQLMVSESETDPTISLHLEEVGTHPSLNYGDEPSTYLSNLQNTPYPFTEIRTPYVQIHAKSDMMQTAIDQYDGDIETFFEELQAYMIEDTYNLAGFQGDGLSLNNAVVDTCDTFNWDCENPTIHGRPALQHINVDTYAHCGGGCSGNPYDQSWPLEPLGWGETHEIGHNLQRGRLQIYEARSSEVSNQIFPLRKHSTYYEDTGISLSGDRVSYEAVFDTLQASVQQQSPFDFVYENIWAADGIYDNNSERMVFYMQVVHCNSDLEFLETGWDIYTLMYLHERLFTHALNDWEAQRTIIGFDLYTEAPWDISGNDFMLISMSLISQRDQRSFFDMWGIEYSDMARDQVASYLFDEAGLFFYPNSNANAIPTSNPILIDGISPWSEH